MAQVEFRDISFHLGGEKPSRPAAPPGIRSMPPDPDVRTGSVKRHAFSMEHLNLTIPDGQTVVVLGPSGCGKTTLLRIAAGLLTPDAGTVLFDGIDAKDVPPGDRGVGMVFQNYALYPFTSRRNILSYFMFRKRTPELDAETAEKYRRTCELLGVEIEYLADRDTRSLSGGEKQRVALGRCITRDPRLFLLDEPFSNLDAKLREKYRFGLRKLLSELAITTIYVTHDQQEALILADLLAIMDVGRIEQLGTPEIIYTAPNSMFVADFLNLSTDTPAINFLDGGAVSSEWQGRTLGLRPDDVEFGDESSASSWRVTITGVRQTPMRRSVVVTARFHGQEVQLRLPADRALDMGQEISLQVQRLHVFDSQTGRRIDTIMP